MAPRHSDALPENPYEPGTQAWGIMEVVRALRSDMLSRHDFAPTRRPTASSPEREAAEMTNFDW